MGGGQRVLLSIAENALKLNLDVVIAIPLGGNLELVIRKLFGDAVSIVGIPEILLTNGKKNSVDFFRMLWRSLRVFKHINILRNSDSIYVNGPRLVPILMFISLFLRRCRVIYHVHLDHGNLEKYVFHISTFFFKTHFVIFNSNFTRNKFFETVKPAKHLDKYVVVENGLSNEFSGRLFVRRAFSAGGKLNVMIVGAIRKEKGVDVALRIAALSPDIVVHIIGAAPSDSIAYARDLESSAPDNVIFYGELNDMPNVYDKLNAHVLLMPSRIPESFGLSLIEGMACSCIGLCRRIGSLTDIALATGAITFNEDEELDSVIEGFLRTSNSDLNDIAESQYNKTMKLYSHNVFVKSISNVIRSSITREL